VIHADECRLLFRCRIHELARPPRISE
jgi:hypothetical protein